MTCVMELSARGTNLSGSVDGLPAARGLISQLKVCLSDAQTEALLLSVNMFGQ